MPICQDHHHIHTSEWVPSQISRYLYGQIDLYFLMLASWILKDVA